MPLPKVGLLFNPRAGKVNSARRGNMLTPEPGDPIEAIRAYAQVQLGASIPEYPAETLEAITQAAQQAVADGIEILLAAGGDGTLRAVAEVLIGTQTVLGVIPVGTVNVLARELGIPLDRPERAVEIALTGRTVPLDVGRVTVAAGPDDVAPVHSRLFLLMCSVGLDAHAVASVNPDLKGVVGTTAYVVSGLTALAGYTPVRFTVTADDFPPETYDAFSIVVSNAASYGGDFRLVTDAEMDDGMLDVTVFSAPPGLPAMQGAVFLRQAAAAALGRLESDPDVRLFRSYRMRIEADTPTAVQLDGDACGLTPLDIEVVPSSLSVRLPMLYLTA